MGHNTKTIGLLACVLMGGATLRADDAANAPAVNPVDAGLKAALPATLGPLKLQADKTEIAPDFGMGTHAVTGHYTADGGTPNGGTVNILDFGPDTPKQAMNMAEMAAGLTTPPQSTDDCKRSKITVAGYPAVQQIGNKGHDFEVKLVVGKRYLVVIDATQTDEAAFGKMIDAVDYKKIEALGK